MNIKHFIARQANRCIRAFSSDRRSTHFRRYVNPLRWQSEEMEPRITPSNVTVGALANATEGGSAGSFELTRTGSTAEGLSVNLSYAGTAASGDYTASPIVYIPQGESSATFNVTDFNDSDVEPTETVIASITSGTGYSIGSPASATISIFDNETPEVTVEAIANAHEDGSNGNFRFTRLGNLSSSLVVDYTFGGSAIEDFDYVELSGTVTFAANGATADVDVTAEDDSTVEPTETVGIEISTGAYYTIGSEGEATIDILDNETPEITVETVADVPEVGVMGTFRFSRIGDLSSSVTVDYTVSGTATADEDYTALSESVTFDENSAWAIVQVYPLVDEELEDEETAVITITSGSGYTVGSEDSATVTISDTTVITVEAIADAEEGGDDGTFRFYRTGGDLNTELTVFYNIGGTATADEDYTTLSGSVTFSENEATVYVTVTADDDETADANEFVQILLQLDDNYQIETVGDASVTIIDASTGSISGSAWIDADDDGVRDTGEIGLSDVTISLFAGTTLVATSSTGQDGNYIFSGVAPGSNYYIQFEALVQDGASISDQDQGADDTKDSDAEPLTGMTAAIAVAAGSAVDNVAAGFTVAAAAPSVRINFPKKLNYYYIRLVMTTDDNGNPGIYTFGAQVIKTYSGTDAREIVETLLLLANWSVVKQGDLRLNILGYTKNKVLQPVIDVNYTFYQIDVVPTPGKPSLDGLNGATVTPGIPMLIPPPPAQYYPTPAAFISFSGSEYVRFVLTVTTPSGNYSAPSVRLTAPGTPSDAAEIVIETVQFNPLEAHQWGDIVMVRGWKKPDVMLKLTLTWTALDSNGDDAGTNLLSVLPMISATPGVIIVVGPGVIV